MAALIDGWSDRCRPFAWTKDAGTILTKAKRSPKTKDSISWGSQVCSACMHREALIRLLLPVRKAQKAGTNATLASLMFDRGLPATWAGNREVHDLVRSVTNPRRRIVR
jgi:hypothetical protein